MKPTKEQELKKVIRLTYKAFYYIAIFLLIPTIGTYFITWPIVKTARDTGILILTLGLALITHKMKKKEKQEQKENEKKDK